jgi:hypothetical protein
VVRIKTKATADPSTRSPRQSSHRMTDPWWFDPLQPNQ